MATRSGACSAVSICVEAPVAGGGDDVVEPAQPAQAPHHQLAQQPLVALVEARQGGFQEGVGRRQRLEGALQHPGGGRAHVVLRRAPGVSRRLRPAPVWEVGGGA